MSKTVMDKSESSDEEDSESLSLFPSRPIIEDADELKFHPGVYLQFLNTSEVYELLEQIYSAVAEEDEEFNQSFVKNFAYSKLLRKYKDKKSMTDIRKFLEEKDLHPYQVASLSTLCPQSVDEAISLIPSLEEKDISVVKEIIEELDLKHTLL
ncbi:DNA-directed RNA polymerase II subunit Rpb4-like [Teleopsis dalmanni]|uniref:DNA-directed RNA polymerase II subunit Rpb4-like n=1 Tax=Teleopsis dalmanni TaxID=139649 RepID=UPI000D32C17D|nr:DNA-directed RNA polymerase II subunit Rpb4-like [Teleopsis dalmanni]XP_037927390.1 DNA-directed RNA polymerase II subunit Rpb4-like [Teleopsis dalmanni]